ncbi:hypothetical protein ACQY0O_004202 [Thecaphora frezii]
MVPSSETYADDHHLAHLSSGISDDPALRAATEAEVDWADDARPYDTLVDDDTSERRPATVRSPNSKTIVPSNYLQDDCSEPCTKAVGMRWSAQTASHASNALIRYATGPTLLPQQVAEVVSNLSLLARVSLKSAAFFIELILEAAKYGTGLGLGITRRALIGAVGTARALHSIGTGQEWDAQAAGKPLTISNSVKNANEAFLSLLDKYTAVGIYLIHHTFTMAELFAMSSFYIAGSSIQAGLAAADESVRLIDGIFGSNETSRALASFITLVRNEFGGDPRFADNGGFGVLATLTKAITAFAVLQNSTYKRSAKSMKMKVLYDCTVLGEVETKSWRSMIVGSGNFVKTQRPVESQLLVQSPNVARSSSTFTNRSSGRFIDTSGSNNPSINDFSHQSNGQAASPESHSMTVPSSRTRPHLGDGLCLTDIGHTYGDHGWTPSGLPSPSVAHVTRPSSACDDDASIMADLDFLVGTDEDLDSMASSVSSIAAEDLPADLRNRLGRFADEELQAGVLVDGPSGTDRVRRYVRKRPGPGRNETVYEITTETIETTETITTTEERRRRPMNRPVSARSDSRLSARYALYDGRNGSSLVERDVTSSHSGHETQSIFEGRRETTYEQEDEWCEIARTTNSPPSRSGSADTLTLHTRSPYARIVDDMDVDDETLTDAPNGRPIALRHHDGQRTDRGDEPSTKMHVVLKTMTKKLIQKRRTIRKIEIHSDTDGDVDDVVVRIEEAPPAQIGQLRASEEDRHSRHTAFVAAQQSSKTAPSSPVNRKHGFSGSHLSRQHSPPAAAETTRVNAKNAEMSTGLQKVLKLAKNSLKGPSGSSARSALASSTLSGRRQLAPESDQKGRTAELDAAMEAPSANATDAPLRTDSRRGTDSEHRSFPLFAKAATPLPSTSTPRSKRTASPAEAEESKAPKQTGLSSPKKTTGRGTGNDLPQIPARTESHAAGSPAFDSGSGGNAKGSAKSTTSFAPAATMGSTRDRRRSRAPSITSMHSFTSRTHTQSTARGPAQGSSEVDSAGAFPRAHLVFNLYKFMRHSSAAYGQNFMRILGIGSLDYFFPDTTKHHANVWAFAHHVGIPVDSILLNSFSEPQPLSSERMSPLVNYVAVDDQAQAVVLTCRGTLGLSDILTDLTCTYEDIKVPGGSRDEVYRVHSGMLASAKRLSSERGTVMQTIRKALDANPDYGLVITGHSLGGGVAALLAMLLGCKSEYFQQQMLQQPWHHKASGANRHPKIFTPFVTGLDCGLPAGRPIHAYAYGVPAVSSPDLSRYCRGLVTSVVHGHDFVPSLSLGVIRDMKNIAQTLCLGQETDTARQIVARVVGLYQDQKKAKAGLVGAPPVGLLDDGEPRPSEPPAHEREQVMEPEELKQGRSRNRANDRNYQDPRLAEDAMDPFSYSQGGGLDPGLAGAAGPGGYGPSRRGTDDPEADLQDWLWSLIKTIRADMIEEKLYPPGEVYCIESFAVFVTPRMQPSSDPVDESRGNPTHTSTSTSAPGTTTASASASSSSKSSEEGRAEAHRVILRYCEDVEKRFSEPIFAKSMLRDHIPTNYELCMSLLFESIVPRAGGDEV